MYFILFNFTECIFFRDNGINLFPFVTTRRSLDDQGYVMSTTSTPTTKTAKTTKVLDDIIRDNCFFYQREYRHVTSRADLDDDVVTSPPVWRQQRRDVDDVVVHVGVLDDFFVTTVATKNTKSSAQAGSPRGNDIA